MIKTIAAIAFLLAAANARAQASLEDLIKKTKTEKDSSLFNAYADLGNYYTNKQKLDSADYYWNLGFALSEKIKYKLGLAKSYMGMASVDNARKKGKESILKLQQALKLYQELGIAKSKMAMINGNIGAIYFQQKEFAKGLEYTREAAAVHFAANDSVQIAFISSSLAHFYISLLQYDSSLHYAKLSVTYAREMEKKYASDISRYKQIVFFRNNSLASWGHSLLKLNRFDEALTILKNGYAQLKEDAAPYEKLAFLKNLSTGYDEAGNPGESLKYAEMMLPVLEKDSVPDFYHFVCGQLSKLYAKAGRYREAYWYSDKLKGINDSLFNKEKFAAIEDIQVKYETELKNQQIQALNKQRKSQRLTMWLALAGIVIAAGFVAFVLRAKLLQKKLFSKKEELLQKEKMLEKNRLEKKMTELEQMALRAQMNPHFIFNCLSSVQLFILRNDNEKVNNYLTNFASLVRQTLDNSGKTLIPLQREIEYLETYLSLERAKSDNQFAYSVEVDEEIEPSGIYVPGMILQPYAENSIKHGVAFKDNNSGNIRVQFKKNGVLYCTIEDNGIGREKAASIKLPGTEYYVSRGMAITGNRIELINRMYNTEITALVSDITDEQGLVCGTRVTIKFPLDLC